MKVQFSSALFDQDLPRFDAAKGFVSTTTLFEAKTGVTIELDTATALVRLSKDTVVRFVPRSRVSRFGEALVAKAEAPALDDFAIDVDVSDFEAPKRTVTTSRTNTLQQNSGLKR